ncbi:MAG: chemotaxis protein CheC [Actinobacteria bacterium]|nr:chemotaxis protein CheC [Actinomycetota bacterium]
MLEEGQVLESELDVLREVANIGSGHAAASMEKWLGKEMALKVPVAAMVPIEDVAETIGDPLETVMGVYSRVQGDMEGHILYLISLEDARELLDIILDPEDRGQGFSPNNLSAIAETGNILFNAYLGAVSELCGLELYPAPPTCTADMLAAIVNTILLEVSDSGDLALYLKTEFEEEDFTSTGNVLFVTDFANLARMVDILEEE